MKMRGCFLALCLAGLAAPVRATLDTPLHVAAAAPITNEFGVTLPGRAASPGALVMVLWAPSNTVYAPATDGQPHPLNPPVSNGLTAIGRSMAPSLANPGRFSISLADPRPKSGRIFVRVFNKPTLEESSFYAESPIFTNTGNREFIAEIGATTNAIDPGDDDADGLNNAWEKSYGSDPDLADSDNDGVADGEEHTLGISPVLADSDGDGVDDGHELRAGTSPADPASHLGVAMLQPNAGNLHVQWASVAGKHYQVEGVGDLIAPAFTNLTAVIPSAGETTTAILTNATEGADPLIMRVRLVED